MVRIGAFEAKNTLGTLLDRVERGEEITITRHGRPVARLVPNVERTDMDQARAALHRMRERAQRLHKEKTGGEFFDWAALKKLRDQERP